MGAPTLRWRLALPSCELEAHQQQPTARAAAKVEPRRCSAEQRDELAPSHFPPRSRQFRCKKCSRTFVRKKIFELDWNIAQLYLFPMLQRTLPAGFIAPCLPPRTDKLPSKRV